MTDQNLTHLAILVDRSGSMGSIAKDMNGGIRQLLADQAKAPGSVVVDVTTFDTIVEFPFEGVRPDDIKVDVLVPRGGTALNDALGATIVRLGEKLAALNEDDRPGHVIFVIATDGAENSSREYTTAQVAAMVTEQREKWGWEFIFMAANIDAFATGRDYGFNRDQTIAFQASGLGAQSSYAAASQSVLRTRAGLNGAFTQDERDAADAS